MNWIDNLPWLLVIAGCLTLGLAPFLPEPHIVEKLRMLVSGTLTKPLDIFDLVFHAIPWVLAIVKAARMFMR
jgi:hypothetical protein